MDLTGVPIGASLRLHAGADPDRPAITHEGRVVTRVELETRTNRLARAYERLGVGTDDIITIALPNGIEFYEACFAVWKLGGIPQPVSAKLPQRERDEIVELASGPLVVGVPDDAYAGRNTVPQGFEPDLALSDEPLEDRVASSWKAPTSGGSTGRPKLILAGAPGVVPQLTASVLQVPSDGVILVPGPLYHNAPFMFSTMGLMVGAHIVVMSRFEPSEFLRLIELHRVEWMWVVPTMMSRVMHLSDEERLSRDVSSLKIVWHGAAACPVWVKAAWHEWIGSEKIWELYAGTESNGGAVIHGPEWDAHPGSVGRPMAPLRIVGPDGADLPPGEVGEIFMQSGQDAPPYRYVGAEARRIHGDWESIGDMGWLDEDGFLYIADRRTDMIVSGGANVYPAEIEAALDEHPMVQTSCVIGLPDDDLGHRVHAIVQTYEPVDEGSLAGWVRERLAPYKVPRTWEFTDEPLRDDAGKTRRTQLRDERLLT